MHLLKKKYLREKLFLFAWYILPLCAAGVLGKLLYPRYILFMTLPLLPLIAYTIDTFWQKTKMNYLFLFIFVLVVLALPLRADYLILTDFLHAPIPDQDIEQYARGWPSGGGVKEAVTFFKKQAQTQKIFIGTEGTFGLLPFSLELYLVDNPHITLRSYWPINHELPQEIATAAKTMPTYVVFYQPCLSCENIDQAPASWPVKQVFQVVRGEGKSRFTVYQIVAH